MEEKESLRKAVEDSPAPAGMTMRLLLYAWNISLRST